MLEPTAKILPLVLFYLFFAFPNDFLFISITPLGRFIAILLILFYSSISTYYGLMMCSVVIIYYRLKAVETTSLSDSCILINNQESFVSNSNEEDMDKFREEHCENNCLKYKGKNVKNENIEHIYPDLKFLNERCNPCDKNCGFTIGKRIKLEENITYPKTNDDWVMPIWNTWFSNNYEIPIAFNNIFSNTYENI